MQVIRLIESSDEELRARSSIKWCRADADVIAADIAETDFRAPEPVLAMLRNSADRSDFGYPDYTEGTPVRLAETFGERMQSRFGWTPVPERVEICGQIMQALCCAILSYTRPGDGILTHSPTYGPITNAIEHFGRICLTLPAADVRDLNDLMAAGATGRAQVRMIVLCNPHNPTGHVFNRVTLNALAELAERNNAVVFNDEAYQDLVYESASYCPAATVDGLRAHTVTFTSAAKSFGLAGLRCAVGYFGSRYLHETFCRLPWHLRSAASLPGINSTIVAWSECETWLRQLRAQLAANRDIVAAWLAHAHGVRGTYPNATYLYWLDLRDTAAGADPRRHLLRTARVALQSGSSFGAGYEGYARLNFGTSQARLHDILDRLTGALLPENG